MEIRKGSDSKFVGTEKRTQEREFIQFYKMNFIDSFYLFSLSFTCRANMTRSLLQSCWEDENLFTVPAPNRERGVFFLGLCCEELEVGGGCGWWWWGYIAGGGKQTTGPAPGQWGQGERSSQPLG